MRTSGIIRDAKDDIKCLHETDIKIGDVVGVMLQSNQTIVLLYSGHLVPVDPMF